MKIKDFLKIRYEDKLWTQEQLDSRTGFRYMFDTGYEQNSWREVLRDPRQKLIRRLAWELVLNICVIIFAIALLIAGVLVCSTDGDIALAILVAIMGLVLLALIPASLKSTAGLAYYLFVSDKNIVDELEPEQNFKELKQSTK